MVATLTLPLSAHELCDAVRHARPFDPARLDRILRLDPSRGMVEVQASARWESLASQLETDAASLARLWAGMPTVGDTVAANAPGPDGRPVSAYVESLMLVMADGELRRASRESHAELFALVVGGQGLFGAVYSITLRLEALARAVAGALPSAALELAAAPGSKRTLRLLVPPARLEPFIAAARERCADWRLGIEGVEVRRTFPETETALRWARREYAQVSLRLAEPPALGGCVRATQVRRELIELALSLGGSFPIACTPEATRAQVEACYPELRGFLAEKRRLDPAEKLSNEWYRHHRSLFSREDCEVRWEVAAEPRPQPPL